MKAKNLDDVVVYQKAMQAHLRKARRKKFISSSELTDFTLRYVEIVKMLTSWMKYLRDSDWDNRG